MSPRPVPPRWLMLKFLLDPSMGSFEVWRANKGDFRTLSSAEVSGMLNWLSHDFPRYSTYEMETWYHYMRNTVIQTLSSPEPPELHDPERGDRPRSGPSAGATDVTSMTDHRSED